MDVGRGEVVQLPPATRDAVVGGHDAAVALHGRRSRHRPRRPHGPLPEQPRRRRLRRRVRRHGRAVTAVGLPRPRAAAVDAAVVAVVAHLSPSGSRWSRPSERWSSARARASRVVKPMAEAASSTKCLAPSPVARSRRGDAAAGEHRVGGDDRAGAAGFRPLVGARPGSRRRVSASPRPVSQVAVSRTTSAGRPARSWSRVNLVQPLLALAAPKRPPFGQRSHAGHHRRRRHRLGLEPERFELVALEAADGERGDGGVAVDQHGPEGHGQQDRERHHQHQQGDASSAPPLDRDRRRPFGQEPQELGVEVTAPLADVRAGAARAGPALGRRRMLR